MKTFFKRILTISVFLLNSFLFAEKTPFDNLFQEKLENGLEVFVLENHTVPLVYVEIAVKCGAFTQEKETAGLFHLYEHLMFKGNSKYKSAQEVKQGIKRFGYCFLETERRGLSALIIIYHSKRPVKRSDLSSGAAQ